ncbi:MAG: sigma 54-dependent Fis family transcriptional regulator [Kofleriaceae bacterium]|jgi:DNA-binding NtrC family response regulator|nr:sigma 54-dependent Fis family transcriptional regulator [Kofleriaceae bacterium]MBP6837657.1 sigma 54-dependent Fis family transcriptional regulator [Kofleriaceae bacterium]MBP9203838.1 sigma 54-dependent Fis family transcriptional regulator [Kofleriaceae bacterium]
MSKFPDFVPPTKVSYLEGGPTLHLRRCTLSTVDEPVSTWTFEGEEVRIGSMEDNELVIRDDTVSRYHCKIVQEESGYVLVDLRSTNGTFVNKVRVREAFLKPGCTIGVGQSQLRFNALEQAVHIVPSQAQQCGYLIGGNAKMREIYAILEKIAPTATTVIIEGETGTGKEVVAQTIHTLSTRRTGELVVFDCGAVPPNLIESELFGHEKGSFTGAMMTRAGLFEQADGGTIFLDELGELPIDLQPKLLRALEGREVRRVGSGKAIKVDVRIIAATNRDLEEEVRAGRFRQDLFYRLSVVRLRMPALRERADDIPLLVGHFLRSGHYNKLPAGGQRVKQVGRDAMTALQAYPWPGNVRELVNVIERAVSFCDGDTLSVADLPDYVRTAKAPAPRPSTARGESRRAATAPSAAAHAVPAPLPLVGPAGGAGEGGRPGQDLLAEGVTFKDGKERWIAAFERDYVVSLLGRHGGNISHAARDADIDRKYFRKLMKKYDIEAPGRDEETVGED